MLHTACQAQYLTRDVPSMRRADYDATHLVKAVKGLDLHGNAYTWVAIDGTNRKIVNANKDDAIAWHAGWAANRIAALGSQPKILIPIPSSKTIISSPEDFRTFKIAQSIAARLPNSVIISGLRFREARPSSREDGGSRDPEVLYPNMELRKDLPPEEIVLIDDVMTSGGHFIASSWKLADHGRAPRLALACGRSLDQPIDNPFSVAPEDIDIAR
jgi:predicted amidophosphoribosyltransferase